MAINFPTSLDTLSNPTGSELLENAVAGLDHDVQHSNANDAIEALEAKVGVNASAVTTTHDYKLSAVTGSAKALTSGTSTQTVSGLTLTAPQVNMGSDANGDLYTRIAGVTSRLAVGATDQILAVQAGLPAWIANPSATNATYATAGISTLDADVRYYAADAGANDTYVITLSPVPSAYTTGMKISFKANTANTGAATINVNSLGAKTIVKGVNTTLADGDIAAGMFCTIIYDGTNFVLQNPVTTAITPTFFGLFKNGGTTKDASDASTTQNIAHGLGVIPKKVRITALASANNVDGNTIAPGYAYTVYNGTTQSSVSRWTSTTDAGKYTSGTSFVINLTQSGSADTQTGVVTFDATNIIITWTKANSPTGTFNLLWEAEA